MVASGWQASGTRVLIVENDAITAMRFRRMEEGGYEVVAVADTAAGAVGSLAAATAADNLPHVVLMDVSLNGEENGIDAAARIRGLCGHVAVVFTTGQSDRSTRQRAAGTNPAD